MFVLFRCISPHAQDAMKNAPQSYFWHAQMCSSQENVDSLISGAQVYHAICRLAADRT